MLTIGSVTVEPSAGTRDASWMLANLLQKSVHERNVIHVKITGEPLEIYTSGRSARAVGALDELRQRHPDAVVAAVSHGDVIRSLLVYYFGAPLDFLQRLMPSVMQGLVVAGARIYGITPPRVPSGRQ
mgnify:CR=1 FL=1